MKSKKKLATLTVFENEVYSNEWEQYMNNVRKNTKRADAYAWRQTVKASPRLAGYWGAK